MLEPSGHGITHGNNEKSSGILPSRADIGFSLFLGMLVFVSRYFTRGALYFVDGPRIVRAIQDHTYVIQPPGYWLYAHLGALISNPTLGLSLWNEMFSAAGIAVFFLLCRKLGLPLRISLLAALAYGSIFFLWFAGDIQSSYASQILFAPLTVYCFLIYRERPATGCLLMCGTSFAVGSGLRPSDGAFLGFLFLFLLFRFVEPWKQRFLLLVFTGALCLAWYIPTQLALHASHGIDLSNQLGSLAFQVSPLLVGINVRSIANILRVVLPLFVAFWMLIPLILQRRSRDTNWICGLWILPGLCFFLLIYMADATYLTFLAGGIVLLAATCEKERLVAPLLFCCFLFNVLLFFGARPLMHRSKGTIAMNYYVVKYCDYGIRHRWTSTAGHHSNASAISPM